MSFNRENVIWQSKDGRWNRGFFTVHDNWWDGDSDDYDPEWDVEYDTTSFEWVATGFVEEQGAVDAWDGANPGGWTTCVYRGNADACNRYDRMAQELKQRTGR